MKLIQNCLAYSIISGDLQAFDVPNVGSILFYASSSGSIYVIGDPLTNSSCINTLLSLFLESFPHACFFQVSELSASYLSSCGYLVNNFGVETELQLDSWQCLGAKSHMLRKQRKKSERAGVVIFEITNDITELNIARGVSDAWLVEGKGTTTELRVLTRPPFFIFERGTRKFAAYCDGKMVAIAFFDPLCLSDLKEGYVFQLIRSNNGPSGVRTHLLLHAADVFRHEGIRKLSLGLSPLSLRSQEQFKYSEFTNFLFRSVKVLSSRIYDYNGIEFYKSRFNGEEKVVYFCSRSYYPLKPVLSFLNATQVIRATIEALTKIKLNSLEAVRSIGQR